MGLGLREAVRVLGNRSGIVWCLYGRLMDFPTGHVGELSA